MGNKDQDLTVHTKKNRRDHHHPKDNNFHPRRDLFSIRCYTCDDKGHISRYFPRNKSGSHKKKGNKRRHHAHTAEDDAPPRKRVKEESEDSSSDALIYALTGTIKDGSNDWLINSGASKHMTGFKESFVKLSEHESPHKGKIGDTGTSLSGPLT